MGKLYNLLILLLIVISTAAWAEGPAPTRKSVAPKQEIGTISHQALVEQEEWLDQIRGQMNHLQTVPVLDRDNLKLDFGLAQFQITIPFR